MREKKKNLLSATKKFQCYLKLKENVFFSLGRKEERWWRLLPSLACAIIPRGSQEQGSAPCLWSVLLRVADVPDQPSGRPVIQLYSGGKKRLETGSVGELCDSRNTIYGVRTMPSWWCGGEINPWIKCSFCLCLTQFRGRRTVSNIYPHEGALGFPKLVCWATKMEPQRVGWGNSK